MKQKARHRALSELAKMVMPGLLEDLEEKKEEKESPLPEMVEEMAEECCGEEGVPESKPKVMGFSVTRLLHDQSKAKPAKKSKRKGKK